MFQIQPTFTFSAWWEGLHHITNHVRVNEPFYIISMTEWHIQRWKILCLASRKVGSQGTVTVRAQQQTRNKPLYIVWTKHESQTTVGSDFALPAEHQGLMCILRIHRHGTSKAVSIQFVAATPYKLTRSDPDDKGQHASEYSLDPRAASGNDKQTQCGAEFHYSKQGNTGVNHRSWPFLFSFHYNSPLLTWCCCPICTPPVQLCAPLFHSP